MIIEHILFLIKTQIPVTDFCHEGSPLIQLYVCVNTQYTVSTGFSLVKSEYTYLYQPKQNLFTELQFFSIGSKKSRRKFVIIGLFLKICMCFEK